ncbi:MAG: PhzF family phenazine biosynthesis protein [Anaerolineae bacterium]|nr:PhzF family phenazine biosynthesis protein [Anaerolineae bacterium]
MAKYPFMQVDAFTETRLGGNPCAILFETDEMSDASMLAIAKEMNLSETAFVRKSSTADFGVRYFTPAEEIPLAGHPTIATTFALVESGRLALTGDHTTIALELKAGIIKVEIYAEGGKAARIVMTQMKPQFLKRYEAEAVMPVFGLSAGDALLNAPLQTVSTGTAQLMIPVRDMDALRRAKMDHEAYVDLRAKGDFFSPHLFCLGGVTEEGDTFARHFGTPPDTVEDPFTGSATGGMAAYLWHHGLIEQPNFTAEQGHWMGRPGRATVEVIGAREDIEAVRVGGQAVTVLRGEFEI